jgi:predicted DNA-binding antitoxin AbrB/MazE fold protein
MGRIIEARFEGGVFKPARPVRIAPGARVKLEITEEEEARGSDDLSDVEAAYAVINAKYPSANVRRAYVTRDELHDR